MPSLDVNMIHPLDLMIFSSSFSLLIHLIQRRWLIVGERRIDCRQRIGLGAARDAVGTPSTHKNRCLAPFGSASPLILDGRREKRTARSSHTALIYRAGGYK